MKVSAKDYLRMPPHLQALFIKLPNPGSEEVRQCFPEAPSAGRYTKSQDTPEVTKRLFGSTIGPRERDNNYAGETGSAARFFYAAPFEQEDFEATRLFYCSKASRKDREEGCEGLEERRVKMQVVQSEGRADFGNKDEVGDQLSGPRRNYHPTVKPTSLMRYLCRLITPPGGTVLDPFAGSGSTGKGAVLEGFSFIGIELDPAYMEIARRRIAWAERQPGIGL